MESLPFLHISKDVIIGVLLTLVVAMGAIIALLYQICVLCLKDCIRRAVLIEFHIKTIDLGIQKLNPGFKPDYLNAEISKFGSGPSEDTFKH